MPLEAAGHLWPLVRYGRATVSAVMSELFGADEAVKFALAANIVYYHDDPDRMLFLRYAVPQASYLAGGGHYVRGGSQALSDRLFALVTAAGGTVETGREADALLFEAGRIVGVGHHARGGGDERCDQARTIFGNAAPQVLAAMLPQDRPRVSFALRATPTVEFLMDRVVRRRPAAAPVRSPQLLEFYRSRLDAQPIANARGFRFDGKGAGRPRALLCGGRFQSHR